MHKRRLRVAPLREQTSFIPDRVGREKKKEHQCTGGLPCDTQGVVWRATHLSGSVIENVHLRRPRDSVSRATSSKVANADAVLDIIIIIFTFKPTKFSLDATPVGNQE